jgi:hypothetical protein
VPAKVCRVRAGIEEEQKNTREYLKNVVVKEKRELGARAVLHEKNNDQTLKGSAQKPEYLHERVGHNPPSFFRQATQLHLRKKRAKLYPQTLRRTSKYLSRTSYLCNAGGRQLLPGTHIGAGAGIAIIGAGAVALTGVDAEATSAHARQQPKAIVTCFLIDFTGDISFSTKCYECALAKARPRVYASRDSGLENFLVQAPSGETGSLFTGFWPAFACTFGYFSPVFPHQASRQSPLNVVK